MDNDPISVESEVHETLRKNFKFKLQPTVAQVRLFERWLAICQEVYNAGLEERKLAWQRRRVTLTAQTQKAELPDLKVALPEVAEVNSQVLQNVLDRLERNFKAFWRGQRTGEKVGYPRYKSAKRYRSFTYPLCGWGGVHVSDGALTLSRIGVVRFRQSRPIEGRAKTITILREADGWYCLISCDQVPVTPFPRTGEETGIDLGLRAFVTCSNGEHIARPRIFQASERRLRARNRRMRRRTVGSARYRKAVRLVAKSYRKMKRQRDDFHWKTARHLLHQYDTVYYEQLHIANMRHGGPLSKGMEDAAWGRFCLRLASKAEEAGKRAVAVSCYYSSQTCSGCGVRVKKDVMVRRHECPDCGLNLDRDHNAALNILRLGQQRAAGQAVQALTWADGPSVA